MKSRVGTKAQPRFGSRDKPVLPPVKPQCSLLPPPSLQEGLLVKAEEPGRARPFLVATLFPVCHFNTSDQRKYPPPPDCIPSLWSCTNCHSYKVEHCKTSCAHICMSLLQNLSSHLESLFHDATNDLPKAMCSEAMGLLSLTQV